MRNDIIDTIRLDITKSSTNVCVYVRTGDTRTLEIVLTNNGNVVNLNKAIFAAIYIEKESSTLYQTVTRTGNKLRYTLHTADVATVGENKCRIVISFEDGTQIASPEFAMIVESLPDLPGDLGTEEGTSAYTALTDALASIDSKTQSAEASANKAEASALRAEAVETDLNTYVTQAAASATAASGSATAAASSATSAESYKTAAANSATASSTSATASATSATASANSATSASGYATAASNSAEDAEGYATSASASATSASASATSASASATAAAQVLDSLTYVVDETETTVEVPTIDADTLGGLYHASDITTLIARVNNLVVADEEGY